MATIKGKWKWNKTCIYSELFSVNGEIHLVSNGEEFAFLRVESDVFWGGEPQMCYRVGYEKHNGEYSTAVYFLENGEVSHEWYDSFEIEEQEIDDELYAFIIANATDITPLTIAEKLTKIAENQQKIYDTGYAEGYQGGLDSFIDTFCNPDNIIPVLYAEYVDVQSTSVNNSESTDKHLIGPAYGLNNENKRVPILYHIEYADMGVDKYYYVGQDTKEGTLYDKWRKIESGKSFGWDSLQKIYVYTAPIIASEEL